MKHIYYGIEQKVTAHCDGFFIQKMEREISKAKESYSDMDRLKYLLQRDLGYLQKGQSTRFLRKNYEAVRNDVVLVEAERDREIKINDSILIEGKSGSITDISYDPTKNTLHIYTSIIGKIDIVEEEMERMERNRDIFIQALEILTEEIDERLKAINQMYDKLSDSPKKSWWQKLFK